MLFSRVQKVPRGDLYLIKLSVKHLTAKPINLIPSLSSPLIREALLKNVPISY